jgi:hypothetical protein
LAAGINHFNQAQIILKLLADGKSARSIDAENSNSQPSIENQLITATLDRLPPNVRGVSCCNCENKASTIVARDRSPKHTSIVGVRNCPFKPSVAVNALLSKAAREYRAFWTIPIADPLLVIALNTTLSDLVARLSQSELGYIINRQVREQARKARK